MNTPEWKVMGEQLRAEAEALAADESISRFVLALRFLVWQKESQSWESLYNELKEEKSNEHG